MRPIRQILRPHISQYINGQDFPHHTFAGVAIDNAVSAALRNSLVEEMHLNMPGKNVLGKHHIPDFQVYAYINDYDYFRGFHKLDPGHYPIFKLYPVFSTNVSITKEIPHNDPIHSPVSVSNPLSGRVSMELYYFAPELHNVESYINAVGDAV